LYRDVNTSVCQMEKRILVRWKRETAVDEIAIFANSNFCLLKKLLSIAVSNEFQASPSLEYKPCRPLVAD